MQKFSTKRIEGSTLTEDDINIVVVTALEGGINYWCTLANPREVYKHVQNDEPISDTCTRILLDGGSVRLVDIEDSKEQWDLTLTKLVDGYNMNCNIRPWDCSIEDGDAITADCIIQYALMGDIVYS